MPAGPRHRGEQRRCKTDQPRAEEHREIAEGLSKRGEGRQSERREGDSLTVGAVTWRVRARRRDASALIWRLELQEA